MAARWQSLRTEDSGALGQSHFAWTVNAMADLVINLAKSPAAEPRRNEKGGCLLAADDARPTPSLQLAALCAAALAARRAGEPQEAMDYLRRLPELEDAEAALKRFADAPTQ